MRLPYIYVERKAASTRNDHIIKLLDRDPKHLIYCFAAGPMSLPVVAGHDPYEVRVRVAGRTKSMAEAVRIGNEVETLYTNGPAGGAGAWKAAREVVAMVSTLIPRSLVSHSIRYEVI